MYFAQQPPIQTTEELLKNERMRMRKFLEVGKLFHDFVAQFFAFWQICFAVLVCLA